MIADQKGTEGYPFYIHQDETPMVINPAEMIRGIVCDLIDGIPSSKISGKVHRTVAHFIIETCEAIRSKEELNRVALSGGVFQNIYLLSLVTEGLRRSGFTVYIHHLVPTNDGGISLGQAVIAHMRLFQT
jgi:hydrogenase maturation protein HypF